MQVDLPAMQHYKRSHLSQKDRSLDNVHWIPIDFERDSLRERILSHPAFDPSQQTLFFWEGVSYYLSRETCLQVLRTIHSLCPPGSVVCLDYVDADDIDPGRTPHPHHTGMAAFRELVARIGEPLLCGFPPVARNLKDELQDCGLKFRVHDHLTPAQVQQRYLTDPDGSHSDATHVFFCVLETLS